MPSQSTTRPSKIPIPAPIARAQRSSQPRVPVWHHPRSSLPIPSRFLRTTAPLVSAPSTSSTRPRHVAASLPRHPVSTRVVPAPSTTDSSLASRKAARDARSRPWLVNALPTGVTPPMTQVKETPAAVEVKTEVDELVQGMASLQMAPVQKKLVKKLVVDGSVKAKAERLRKLREQYASSWQKAGRPVVPRSKVRETKREELIQAKLDKERRTRRTQLVLKPALKSGLEPTPILDSEEHLAPEIRACHAYRRRRAGPEDLDDKEVLADKGKYGRQIEPLWEVLRGLREEWGGDANDRKLGIALDEFPDPDPAREVRVSFALTPQSFASVVDRPDIPTALFGTQANQRTYWQSHWKIPQRETDTRPVSSGAYVPMLDTDIQTSLARFGYGLLESQDPEDVARTQLQLTAFWRDDNLDDLCDLPISADALLERTARDWREFGAGWEEYWATDGEDVPKWCTQQHEEWKRRGGGGGGDEAAEMDAADAGKVEDEEDCEMF